MNISRLARIVVTASALVLAPVGTVASAQAATVPCAIAVGPLTRDQESVVNDYQVLVAKANSKHTAVPLMPEEVFVLIGCMSPASQTSAAAASLGATTTPPPTGSQPAASSTPAPSATPTTVTTSDFTFTCPANGSEQSAAEHDQRLRDPGRQGQQQAHGGATHPARGGRLYRLPVNKTTSSRAGPPASGPNPSALACA